MPAERKKKKREPQAPVERMLGMMGNEEYVSKH